MSEKVLILVEPSTLDVARPPGEVYWHILVGKDELEAAGPSEMVGGWRGQLVVDGETIFITATRGAQREAEARIGEEVLADPALIHGVYCDLLGQQLLDMFNEGWQPE